MMLGRVHDVRKSVRIAATEAPPRVVTSNGSNFGEPPGERKRGGDNFTGRMPFQMGQRG